MKQYTYIMIKPDGVEAGLVKEIAKRIKNAGLEIVEFDVQKLTGEILDEHYAHVKDRDFYPEMKAFMLSNVVVPMIVYGEDAVFAMRELMGPTNSNEAKPGTIRGDYGDKEVINRNVIHGADSPENAIIEIERFFKIKLEQPK